MKRGFSHIGAPPFREIRQVGEKIGKDVRKDVRKEWEKDRGGNNTYVECVDNRLTSVED